MFKKSTLIAVVMTALLGAGSAFAGSGKLIGGTITNLNLDNGVGTLTIREHKTDRTRSFDVTEQTQVTIKRPAVGSHIPRTVSATPRDLKVGDNVQLDVKTQVDGRVVVVGYEVLPVVVPAAATAEPVAEAPVVDNDYVAYQDNTGGNATDYAYDNLPATATALPALAVFGLSSLLLAGALWIRRKRSSQ